MDLENGVDVIVMVMLFLLLNMMKFMVDNIFIVLLRNVLLDDLFDMDGVKYIFVEVFGLLMKVVV